MTNREQQSFRSSDSGKDMRFTTGIRFDRLQTTVGLFIVRAQHHNYKTGYDGHNFNVNIDLGEWIRFIIFYF
jgi:hypothetical protein